MRKLTLSFVLVLLLVLGVLVWPTRYRYERLRVSGGTETVLRIDRLTGRAAYFNPGKGWVDPEAAARWEALKFIPDPPPGFVLEQDLSKYSDDELRRMAGVDKDGKPLKK